MPSSAPQGAQTILIAEDEPQIRDLLLTALRRAGYRVVTASDGEDAWEKVEELRTEGSKIDLLLADVVMPRLGGVALAERVQEAFPNAPVLFISGYRDRDTPPGAVVLSKPFGYEALLGEIREALKGSVPLP